MVNICLQEDLSRNHLLGKNDLILFGYVLSSARSQVINQWSLAHVLRNQIQMLAGEDQADELDQVVMFQSAKKWVLG